MSLKQSTLGALIALTAIITSASSEACTNFLIEAEGDTFINGRSMEFAQPLGTQVVIQPRGDSIQTEAPGNKNGMKWTSKYGYVTMIGLGLNRAVDGLNEKGLSFGALWQPDSVFPKIDENQPQNVVPLDFMGNYILGNFATVEEVKQGLEKIQVWGRTIPELGMVPPLHFTVHDSSGKSIVIEFLNGKTEIFDNPIGVLTNAPEFPWHLANLRNYTRLTNQQASAVNVNGFSVGPVGQGAGFMGMPGDWTPPSRFIRAAFLVNFAAKGKTAESGVNIAAHILNTFDIPLGIVASDGIYEFTQWIVIKDLKNLVFYYRAYENLILKKIDLKSQDFQEGMESKMLTLNE